MYTTPTQSRTPMPSAITEHLQDAYFHDSWAISAADTSLSALGQFLKALSATPAWVNALMTIRNKGVAMLGLKNLGVLSELNRNKPESAYRPGDRIGIFTLIANTADEVLVGDKDKHLDVVLSVHKLTETHTGHVTVTVTTVVHVHNWLGRLYMIPVKPMHRIIAPSVLKAVGHNFNKA